MLIFRWQVCQDTSAYFSSFHWKKLPNDIHPLKPEIPGWPSYPLFPNVGEEFSWAFLFNCIGPFFLVNKIPLIPSFFTTENASFQLNNQFSQVKRLQLQPVSQAVAVASFLPSVTHT